MDKNKVLSAVNVIIVQDGRIVLSRRHNTGWQDGKLAIPGGHAFAHESPRSAAVREVQEELGLVVDPRALQFVCVAPRNTTPDEFVSYEFLYELRNSEKVINMEPEKCSELVWASPSQLPDDIIYDFKVIIEQGLIGGQRYVEIHY